MFGLNNIIDIAVYATLSKFPNALKDYHKNRFCLHDITEMLTNELIDKHGGMFVEDATKNFANINDLAMGDKNIFEIAP